VRVADAAAAWGLRAKSSATFQTVAALFAYGVAEVAGRGDTRQIRISDLTGRLFADSPPSREAQRNIIAEAALKPKLIAHYAARWRAGRPGNAVCIGELKSGHGFTDAAAARFLEIFDEAMRFADASATGIRPDDRQEGSVDLALGNGSSVAQDGEVLHIVQRDRRLEIKADVDLEGLRTLQQMLPHYRAILALPLPKSPEAPESENEPGGSSTKSAQRAVDGEAQHRRAPFPVLGRKTCRVSIHSCRARGRISR
jgi:hypothetical protein